MLTTPTAALTLEEQLDRQSVVDEGPPTEDKATLASSALDSGSTEEDGTALADQLALVKLAPTTAGPESSGNPFDRLPFEVVEVIFSLVHQDWQRMASPAQLLLVSRRWKALATAMPSLWQDTSLLRVPHNISTPLIWTYSPFRQESKRNNPQAAFLHRMADLSQHTLQHFELEAHVWSDRDEELQAILECLMKSRTTLRSLTLLTTSTSESYVWRKQCTSRCDLLPLGIVMQCPKVTDVQLSLSDQIFTRPTSMPPRPWESKPSFRELKLDCWGGHPDRQDSDGGARGGFLHRASRLRTLTLYNLWG